MEIIYVIEILSYNDSPIRIDELTNNIVNSLNNTRNTQAARAQSRVTTATGNFMNQPFQMGLTLSEMDIILN